MELISMGTAREELKVNHGACAVLKRKLEAARAATSKARALHETIVSQAFEHEAGERRASLSLKDKIKAAIKGGAEPTFEDIPKSTAERADIEARRKVSEQAVADLVEEERECQEAHSAALTAVASSVEMVMKDEARSICERWSDLEAEVRAAQAKAVSVRRHVGRSYGPVHNVGCAVGEHMDRQVWDAILLNDKEDTDLERNRAVKGAWDAFANALIHDADATLDFVAVDRVSEGT
jgi:hypothetical protein